MASIPLPGKKRKAPVSIPVLSFFTGGGLMDMGFEQAGFQVVWTNEMDPEFVRLYEAGMTAWRRAADPQAKEAKITAPGRLMEAGEPTEVLQQAFGSAPPPLFGMIGGPPCQDFSIAGLQAGFAGTRGSVTHEYCLYVHYMRPAFFVMENVTGLLRTKHRQGFEDLLEFLGRDYVTDFSLLNSLDYGVPQNRERLFLIGLRRDLLKPTIAPETFQMGWANWVVEQTHAGVKGKYKWPTVVSKGKEPKPPRTAKQLRLCVERCLVPEELESSTPNATDRFNLYSDKPANTPEGMVSNRSFKRLHRYRFSPTACYGNNEVHLHPWRNERLSVREVLRIQGVEDSYVLPPGQPLSAKFKMIGNGVPVPLAYGIARTVSRLLQAYCTLPAGAAVAPAPTRPRRRRAAEPLLAQAPVLF
ncbi:DNA cytosine methyltransferase [Hymenobacter sp. BT635]|uniref:DNA (cytosine-5-)-methyltransferase n=1 Tax=Hymenobacter nitidus TaxID=2880929 RepID=A0ABS8AIV2_9BACT|nr:DNA cytosine methyltransferase [Hymenobacter nitidus]MCB2380358.1 DNA cytosine methyltransferase [Hymenobacter nitidus]